ncbi:tryptophan halogenase family protein [Paraglaciecola arctica]|uniref:Tryptophan halogenase n=1 Tax=Paraglaciecola arctica BSs20135 TaxID=493475 RepID=K6Y2S1_9ALTE|nr:tryptophan halogenase family protein [Paraglaciecola arctica]GAC18241.1 tryptophan halogenase [Paraglaciecola arctica BSs20135]
MQNTLKSICIVGGGTSGWMAATLLTTALRGSNIQITVIESPDIATIGVGESTVPSMMDFLQASQINLKEFIQATSATFKLGIRFDDWLTQGESYFHPFGRVGKDINGFDFYQAWLKSLADGQTSRWVDHSPSAIMAEHERFMLRPHQSNQTQPENWVLSHFAHSLHLDAIQVARYLRDLCHKRGVTRIEATVKNVNVDKKDFIRSLELDNGSIVESNFFIDCTGFKGLLIENSLKVGYQDWSHYLPCNRAVTVQTENVANPVPYTIATAREAGWTWKIPLQHRTGNGYVFSSEHCSDEQATETLLNSVNGKLINNPKIIPFVTGKREKIWHNNCLALGLAAGFLEPLESTAIHLVYKTLVHFIKYFPDMDFDTCNELAFNQKIDVDYTEIRDFIILHYCTSGRDDSDFWRWCQTMPVPDSLSEKIRLFRQRGQIEHSTEPFFTSDSWYSILEGMKIRPQKYHPLLDGFDSQGLANTLHKNIENIRSTVLKMPSHHDYIQANCQATHQNAKATI